MTKNVNFFLISKIQSRSCFKGKFFIYFLIFLSLFSLADKTIAGEKDPLCRVSFIEKQITPLWVTFPLEGKTSDEKIQAGITEVEIYIFPKLSETDTNRVGF